jgi:hypothetical protein
MLGLGVLVFLLSLIFVPAHASGRGVYGVGLRPLACWDCGFESPQKRGCLSSLCFVSCHVKVFVSVWSLVQVCPTSYGVCNRVWSRIIDNEEALSHCSCCAMVKTMLVLSCRIVYRSMNINIANPLLFYWPLDTDISFEILPSNLPFVSVSKYIV